MTEATATAVDATGTTALPAPGGTPADAIPATREEALSRKAELMANPEWRERYLKGGREELDRMKALHQVIYNVGGNTEPEHEKQLRAQHSESWRDFADLPDDVIEQIKNRTPVSAEEYRRAQQAKERMLSDLAFQKKYFDGDREARRQMACVSIILGSPIAHSN